MTKDIFFVLLNIILMLMVAINLEDRMENFQILICMCVFKQLEINLLNFSFSVN